MGTRYALILSLAAAMLAGCGAAQPQPIVPVTAQRASSWMAPNSSSQDLLYVSNGSNVNVYSYPGLTIVGQLAFFGYAGSECSDSSGNVFIIDGYRSRVVEVAHGGTQPIGTWSTPQMDPIGCAVDPTSGDLAVTNGGGAHGSGGSLAVFAGINKAPTIYIDPKVPGYAYCAYDPQGNLYFDGLSSQDNFIIDELPHGGTTLEELKLDFQPGEAPAGVQWAGKYLAVGQDLRPTIFQYRLKGMRAIRITQTPLQSAYWIHQFLIVGKQVIVPNVYYHGYEEESNLLFFSYPHGGEDTNGIAPGQITYGVALSRATK